MSIRIFFTIAAIAAIAACNDADTSSINTPSGAAVAEPGKQTVIQWIDSARNYGKINEGQKLAVSFRFRNSGNHPLVIKSVAPSCGCTVADYPKQPIAPGAEGEITGVFDSHGREGLQHKELTVTANTVSEEKIFFEVDVIGKKQPAEGANN